MNKTEIKFFHLAKKYVFFLRNCLKSYGGFDKIEAVQSNNVVNAHLYMKII